MWRLFGASWHLYSLVRAQRGTNLALCLAKLAAIRPNLRFKTSTSRSKAVPSDFYSVTSLPQDFMKHVTSTALEIQIKNNDVSGFRRPSCSQDNRDQHEIGDGMAQVGPSKMLKNHWFSFVFQGWRGSGAHLGPARRQHGRQRGQLGRPGLNLDRPEG